MRNIVLLGALLAGCSGDGGSITCDDGEVGGAYLLEWSKIDGDCATPPASVQIIRDTDQAGPEDEECVEVSSQERADGCGGALELNCTSPADGISSAISIAIEQTSDNGDQLEAIVTMTVRETATGDLACIGTYDVKYTRQ